MNPILLIEDNENDQRLTTLALRRGGVSNPITAVADGVAALDYLFGGDDLEEEQAPLPALVLLDLNLPKIPGLEVLRRLRDNARTRYLPVIVLTSSVEEADVLRSRALGANAFISKPVVMATLLNAALSLGLKLFLTGERSAP